MLNRSLRILLADIEGQVVLLLRGLLSEQEQPVTIDAVAGCEAALASIEEGRHDLCFIGHPTGGSGVATIARTVAAGYTIPLILVTETYDREVDMAAIAAGAADCLSTTELTASLLDRSINHAVQRRGLVEALRKSEETLARAQRIARVGSWDWNIRTSEMYWSQETYRILGVRPLQANATYESFLSAVYPGDRQAVNRAINEAIYLQNALGIEHRIVSCDGVERIVYQQAEILLDLEGKPHRMVGTVQDVTERRRVEDALRQIEEMFSKAFHASPDWMAISNASNGRYMEVNDAFLALTGYARSECIGKTSLELGLWVDPDQQVRMLKRLDEHGVVRNLEVEFRTKSGETRHMLWSADVIELKGEACLIAVARDVTEMRELESELMKSQEELWRKHEELRKVFRLVEAGKREWEKTMDHVGDMIVLVDTRGKIRRCNKAFQQFVALPFEGLVGQDWVELLHERELVTGTIYLESMELYHRPTGRWFVLNPYPFENKVYPEGGGTVVTIHDTTEIKCYSEQVDRINRQLVQAHQELKSLQESRQDEARRSVTDLHCDPGGTAG